jgi:hypothetical protein
MIRTQQVLQRREIHIDPDSDGVCDNLANMVGNNRCVQSFSTIHFGVPFPCHTPQWCGQNHAQARNSNAAQCKTQDMEATSAAYSGTNAKLQRGPNSKLSHPTVSIFWSDGHLLAMVGAGTAAAAATAGIRIWRPYERETSSLGTRTCTKAAINATQSSARPLGRPAPLRRFFAIVTSQPWIQLTGYRA